MALGAGRHANGLLRGPEELVDVARRLDLAEANYDAAAVAWRTALERLPADLRGALAQSAAASAAPMST